VVVQRFKTKNRLGGRIHFTRVPEKRVRLETRRKRRGCLCHVERRATNPPRRMFQRESDSKTTGRNGRPLPWAGGPQKDQNTERKEESSASGTIKVRRKTKGRSICVWRNRQKKKKKTETTTDVRPRHRRCPLGATLYARQTVLQRVNWGKRSGGAKARHRP